PLGGGVAGRPATVVLASNHQQGNLTLLIGLSRFKNTHHFAFRHHLGNTAFHAGNNLVAQTNVGEGRTFDHFVVGTTRGVVVEVFLLHTLGQQEVSGRCAQADRTRWRDVVGGDGVTQNRQRTHAAQVGDGSRVALQAVKIGRFANVGAVCFPWVVAAIAFAGQGIPRLATVVQLGVALDEQVAVVSAVDGFLHFGRFGPDVAQVDVFTVLIFAQRVAGQVHIQVAGQGVGHDQSGRCQVSSAYVGVNTAFKVAVARQHGSSNQLFRFNRVDDIGRQRSRTAVTRGAAKTGNVETQHVQVILQLGAFQHVGGYLATRYQRGLDPGLAAQATSHGVASQQTGGHHIGGVGG